MNKQIHHWTGSSLMSQSKELSPSLSLWLKCDYRLLCQHLSCLFQQIFAEKKKKNHYLLQEIPIDRFIGENNLLTSANHCLTNHSLFMATLQDPHFAVPNSPTLSHHRLRTIPISSAWKAHLKPLEAKPQRAINISSLIFPSETLLRLCRGSMLPHWNKV